MDEMELTRSQTAGTTQLVSVRSKCMAQGLVLTRLLTRQQILAAEAPVYVNAVDGKPHVEFVAKFIMDITS